MYRAEIVLKNDNVLTCTAESYDVYDDVIVCKAEKEVMTVFKSEISYFIVSEVEEWMYQKKKGM